MVHGIYPYRPSYVGWTESGAQNGTPDGMLVSLVVVRQALFGWSGTGEGGGPFLYSLLDKPQ